MNDYVFHELYDDELNRNIERLETSITWMKGHPLFNRDYNQPNQEEKDDGHDPIRRK